MLQQQRTSSEMKRVCQGAAEIMERKRKKKRKEKKGGHEAARYQNKQTVVVRMLAACSLARSPLKRIVRVKLKFHPVDDSPSCQWRPWWLVLIRIIVLFVSQTERKPPRADVRMYGDRSLKHNRSALGLM